MAAERALRPALSFVLLALLLAGCAHSLAGRSTGELYQDLTAIRNVRFYCSGSTLFYEPGGEALEQRLAALRPWLATALGADEFAGMEAHAEEEIGLLDMTRCATTEERARSLAEYRRRLEELERRSRLQP